VFLFLRCFCLMKFVRTNQPLRKMASTDQEVYQICTDEKFRRLRMKRLTVFMLGK
jgi:hypothetical protein